MIIWWIGLIYLSTKIKPIKPKITLKNHCISRSHQVPSENGKTGHFTKVTFRFICILALEVKALSWKWWKRCLQHFLLSPWGPLPFMLRSAAYTPSLPFLEGHLPQFCGLQRESHYYITWKWFISCHIAFTPPWNQSCRNCRLSPGEKRAEDVAKRHLLVENTLDVLCPSRRHAYSGKC